MKNWKKSSKFHQCRGLPGEPEYCARKTRFYIEQAHPQARINLNLSEHEKRYLRQQALGRSSMPKPDDDSDFLARFDEHEIDVANAERDFYQRQPKTRSYYCETHRKKIDPEMKRRRNMGKSRRNSF